MIKSNHRRICYASKIILLIIMLSINIILNIILSSLDDYLDYSLSDQLFWICSFTFSSVFCLIPVGFAVFKVCCRCTDTFAVDRPGFCLSGVCMWTNILALIWKSGPHCTSYQFRNQTIYNDLLHMLIFRLFLFHWKPIYSILCTITIKPVVYYAYI